MFIPTPFPCDFSPCNNLSPAATCTNVNNTFTCDCNSPDYHGDTCEYYSFCASAVIVQLELCKNNGTCVNSADYNFHTCDCEPDFTGFTCEIPIPCSTPFNQCQNSGVCTNSIDFEDFNCDCSAIDFTGSLCETPVPCADSPCENGGSCTNSIDFADFTCDCSFTSFTGDVCETPIPCASDPCQNSGVCNNSNDFLTFSCACTSDFTGGICDIPIPCSSSPCLNNGICTDIDNFSNFECDCTEPFSGDTCEIEEITTSPCDNGSPCANGGICTGVSSTEFNCECPPEAFPNYGPLCDLTPNDFAVGECITGTGDCGCQGFGIKNGEFFQDIPNPNFNFCLSGGNSCFCYHYFV